MGRYTILVLLIFLSVLIDLYVYQGIKVLTLHLRPATRAMIHGAYWGVTAFAVAPFLVGGLVLHGSLSIFRDIYRIFVPPSAEELHL